MYFEEYDGTGQYSLTAKAFHHLKHDIIKGKYKPGESLVETKLAKEMGVSRTPVREAIRLLEYEGLVVNTPNKGTIVQGISAQDINDIYTIRTLIEGLAARWAVEKITPDELNHLEETLELMEFYKAKGDLENVAKLDTKFHEIIYRACKSKPLLQVLMNFHDLAQRARSASITAAGRVEKTLEEHREIVDAIRRKDPAAAEKAMTDHVLGVINNMKTSQLLGKED